MWFVDISVRSIIVHVVPLSAAPQVKPSTLIVWLQPLPNIVSMLRRSRCPTLIYCSQWLQPPPCVVWVLPHVRFRGSRLCPTLFHCMAAAASQCVLGAAPCSISWLLPNVFNRLPVCGLHLTLIKALSLWLSESDPCVSATCPTWARCMSRWVWIRWVFV